MILANDHDTRAFRELLAIWILLATTFFAAGVCLVVRRKSFWGKFLGCLLGLGGLLILFTLVISLLIAYNGDFN